MHKHPITAPQSLIFYRLIALWALSEAMLGGIIHGLRIPVSGLIVGSCAVICICLIAWYVPKKGSILKATIIVAFRIEPFLGIYHAIKQMHTTAQLPTIKPETGIRNP